MVWGWKNEVDQKNFCHWPYSEIIDSIQIFVSSSDSTFMENQAALIWKTGKGMVDLSKGVEVMGILNVTPDSFSDGGKFLLEDFAVRHAAQMVEEGASIIDVGGESTRPGADVVETKEEIRRVVPVVQRLSKEVNALISIDTRKPGVASEAIAAGAHIVNDVSGGNYDQGMKRVVAESGAGYVLMHMLGEPKTMQNRPSYEDVVSDVKSFFYNRLNEFQSEGVDSDQVVLDVGIGFGKTLRNNLDLLKNLDSFLELNRPLLLGVSRKSWIDALDQSSVEDRVGGSLAGALWGVDRGAKVLRVHDVKATVQAIKIWRSLNLDRGRNSAL